MIRVFVVLIVIVTVGTLLYQMPAFFGFSSASGSEGRVKGAQTVSGDVSVIAASRDGGETFIPAELNARGAASVIDIVFSEGRGYMATDRGIFVSDDGGATWFPAADEMETLTSLRILAIAVERGNPDAVYVSAQRGAAALLFFSADGLRTMEKVYESNEGIAASAMIYRGPPAGETGGNLYLGMSNGEMLVYNKEGRTFRGMGRVAAGVTDLAIKNSGLIYAATAGKGVYVSSGNGQWRQAKGGLQRLAGSLDVRDLGGRDSAASVIYAATAYGLLRTNDAGASWAVLNTVVPQNSPMNSVLITEQGTIFAAKKNILYKSTDSGASWQILTPVDPSREIGVLESSDDGQTIFIGTRGAATIKLRRGGFSDIDWTKFR